MSETALVKLIQTGASYIGSRLFRNNVGAAVNPAGRIVRYGLGVGTSDLIGFTSVRVTSDMVGKTLAVFTACEVKSALGRLTKEQRAFLDMVKSSGGIAVCARSVLDFETAVAIYKG